MFEVTSAFIKLWFEFVLRCYIEQDHSRRSRPKSLISDESMFCAGHLSGGADTCKQDSGGPAVAEIKGKATLVGK